ncbi:hypothetical protein AALP_AA2G129900 [Arabis alpina]|uniref:Uncharacterized protein n=1 Tax=Arabis alpina TaxID=50452 RepID=A0A087HH31_ARAAL|nr:hypothetical protein AALP_AA2G129900 [Arabis alpina]
MKPLPPIDFTTLLYPYTHICGLCIPLPYIPPYKPFYSYSLGRFGVIGMGYDQAIQMQSTWINGFIVIAFSQYVILISHRLI